MILAVVAQAIVQLGRGYVRSPARLALALAALLASLTGPHPIAILIGAGLVTLAPRLARGGLRVVTVPQIFLTFLKIGAVQFGSGYVLLSFLRADLVARWHWIDEKTLLDAVAVGQFTPGPVFTTATFLGYRLAGVAGAVAATVGIFLPAFVLVALGGRLIPRLRRSPAASAFLDGVNVGSVALMTAVLLQLARTALVDPLTIAIGALATLLLVTRRASSVAVILGGAAAGWLHGCWSG